MKTIVITLFILVLFVPFANAEYVLTMKDGKTLTWSNYTEEDNNYCTTKSFGKFCIPKSDVASIEKEEDPEGATVTTTKKKSEAIEKEEDPEGATVTTTKKKSEAADHEKANAPACEIVSYYTYEGVEAVHRGTVWKEICMTVTVRNNSSSPQNLNVNNIKVTTAKGNIVHPKNVSSGYLNPDETIKVDVCFGTLLSLPLVVECKF